MIDNNVWNSFEEIGLSLYVILIFSMIIRTKLLYTDFDVILSFERDQLTLHDNGSYWHNDDFMQRPYYSFTDCF